MVISKRLRLQPRGAIKGGFVALAADVKHGTVHLVGEIVVRRWRFWQRRLPIRGKYRVDPAHLLSANCRRGVRLHLGPLRATVGDSVNPQMTLVGLTYLGHPRLRGHAVIGLAGRYLERKSFALRGRALGVPVDLYAK